MMRAGWFRGHGVCWRSGGSLTRRHWMAVAVDSYYFELIEVVGDDNNGSIVSVDGA